MSGSQSVQPGEHGKPACRGCARCAWYHLAAELQQVGVDHEDDWSVTRYKDRIASGHSVVCGREARNQASMPLQIYRPPFSTGRGAGLAAQGDGTDAKPDLGVRYRLTQILTPSAPDDSFLF